MGIKYIGDIYKQVQCRLYTLPLTERHKAPMVAEGFTQELGIDYGESYALVAKMIIVRTLLTIVAVH